jgi:pimeloyl-ACP methyl ester carboxylesterase
VLNGHIRIFDRGHGPAVVMIQGLHGRWEWTKPALEELSKRCRTISYSLCGDIGAGASRPDPSQGFDSYVQQLETVLDRAGVRDASICGVSFGGLVALRFAATRPERVRSLIIASSPAPGWKPNARQTRWLSRPWTSTPEFVVSAPWRIWPEVQSALPTLGARLGFFVLQGVRAASAPMIPSLMAERIHQSQQLDFAADCSHIRVPTLVVTGEEGLDRVVPVSSTRTFCSLISGAECEVLERTGHLGVLTKPSRFAELVGNFVHAHDH